MGMQVETTAGVVVERELDVVLAASIAPVVDRGLVERLVSGARDRGVAIDGEGGLLAHLTKLVVES
ncbi:MAG: hypothetical protein QM630_08110, partial [Microbacterium sp.]